MQNPNALISMAMVSNNSNNPYSAFCEYIKYCVFTNVADTITVKELKSAVSQEFGVNLPYNILMECVSKIAKKGYIEKKGHNIKRIGSFDTLRFEHDRLEYQETEQMLIKGLIDYMQSYGRTWSDKYAREQLIQVLDRGRLAHEIFIREHSDEEPTSDHSSVTNDIDEVVLNSNEAANSESDEEPLFSDSGFVGKYISDLLSADTPQKRYLQKVAEGLMICAGTYQLPSDERVSAPAQIKDTEFFFDTRLLLRFVGCAGEAASTAANELVGLIQNAGGKIYYYPQTLEEMNGAFDDAIRRLKYSYPPADNEMRLYASNIKNSITVMAAKKASLQEELSRSGIYLRPLATYNETEKMQFGFSQSDLQQYMQNNLSWDEKTIENDVLSIWETHMKRAGNYSEYCGTRAKLPVFVTTNSQLVSIVMNYRENRTMTREISGWRVNRLPVITDIRLTCRLWSPATQSERMSLLYLTANAVAAQRPTRRYLDTICKLAIELEKNTPEYSQIPLPAFFDDNVTNVILEHTRGVDDNLDIGTFAASIAELAEWKAKEQEDITLKVSNDLRKSSEKFIDQTQSIIDGAVDANKKCLSRRHIIKLEILLHWGIVSAGVFAAVGVLMSFLFGDWRYILVAVVLEVTQQIISSQRIVSWCMRKCLPQIEDCVTSRIIKNLRKAEIPYQNDIVRLTMERNSLIVRSRKVLENEK